MAKPIEKEDSINELRVLEQNITNLLMQKQAFETELTEFNNALKEVEEADKDEIYHLVGSILIKTSKDKTIADLKNKKKTIEMHLESIEKQERLIEHKAEQLKKEIQKN